MKVVMLSTQAGPEGIYHPGMLQTVDAKQAEFLKRNGYARDYDSEKDRRAVAGPVKAGDKVS